MTNLSEATKLKRPQFQTRKILVIGTDQRDLAVAMIRNLPIDPHCPLEVRVGEQIKVRGLDANAYYWMRLTEIAEQAWFDGKQYAKEVWHEYCRQKIMQEFVTIKSGERVHKWVESPTGNAVVISTTQLEKKCFADYVTACEAFGTGLGVMFSENPRGN